MGNQIFSNWVTSDTNRVAPPTVTSVGYGADGEASCTLEEILSVRREQCSRMMEMAWGTRSSGVPMSRVVFPPVRKDRKSVV